MTDSRWMTSSSTPTKTRRAARQRCKSRSSAASVSPGDAVFKKVAGQIAKAISKPDFWTGEMS